MTPNELSLAIAAAKRLPKPPVRKTVTIDEGSVYPITLELTPRKDGSLLPKGIYRGYKGRLVVRIPTGKQGGTKYVGTFLSVTEAVQAIEAIQPPTSPTP